MVAFVLTLLVALVAIAMFVFVAEWIRLKLDPWIQRRRERRQLEESSRRWRDEL